MISNTVTLFRIGLTVPLFLLLATDGPGMLALLLFLGAGLLDVADGKLARAMGESSRLGAFLDLAGDRLLTLSAVVGLIASESLSLVGVLAGMILVARCAIVATAGEALGGPDKLKASSLEAAKIGLSFAGLGLAMAPVIPVEMPFGQMQLVETLLVGAAFLCAVTIVDYLRQAVRSLQAV